MSEVTLHEGQVENLHITAVYFNWQPLVHMLRQQKVQISNYKF